MIQTLERPNALVDNYKLQKGLDQIGLKLSEAQFNDLNMGKTVFLESMELGKIGSIFIIASALFATNQEQNQKQIALKNLSNNTHDCFSCLGITLYCWYSEVMGEKLCLYFTLIDSIPAVKICCPIRAIS